MLVGVARRFIGNAFKRNPVGLDMRGSLVAMPLAAVNQITVLGAARVLDQKHVTAARALQEQSEERCERANAPNHCRSALAGGGAIHR